MVFSIHGNTLAVAVRKPDADRRRTGTNPERVQNFAEMIPYLHKAERGRELTGIRSIHAGLSSGQNDFQTARAVSLLKSSLSDRAESLSKDDADIP